MLPCHCCANRFMLPCCYCADRSILLRSCVHIVTVSIVPCCYSVVLLSFQCCVRVISMYVLSPQLYHHYTPMYISNIAVSIIIPMSVIQCCQVTAVPIISFCYLALSIIVTVYILLSSWSCNLHLIA